MEHKRATEKQKETEEAEKRLCSRNIALDWFERHGAALDARYRKLVASRLEKNLFPVLGEMQIKDIQPADVLQAAQGMRGSCPSILRPEKPQRLKAA